MKIFMKKNVLKFCGFVAVFVMFSSVAFAMNVEVISAKKIFSVDDRFEVSFKVDAQGESINAVAGTIDFSSDLFSMEEIRNGNTIVGNWVQKPVPSNGVFDFSFIIPHGYKGVLSPYYSGYKPGKMFSAVFLAKKAGSGYIKISNGEAYLNDGKGTKTNSHSDTLYVDVSDTVNSSAKAYTKPKSVDFKDVLPPNKFVVLLSSDESISDGKWFLAFDAKDSGDGIDHYEIYEGKPNGLYGDNWVRAESPYVIKDQTLSSYIYVKAVDKNGNSKIEQVLPANLEPWYTYISFWVAIILGCFIPFFMTRFKFWRFK